MTENYEFYQSRSKETLRLFKKWKGMRSASEFIGLAMAIGIYFLTPSFWAFLAVTAFVATVYFLLRHFEKKTFRTMEAEYAEVSTPPISDSLSEEQAAELKRQFELALKENKPK